MHRKKIAKGAKAEKENAERAEKEEELSPEIKSDVEAAAEEELKRRAKAQEILEAQAESKRLEILSMLEKAVKEWQETGNIGDTGLVPQKSLKDLLKSNVQAAGRLKGKVLGLIRRLAELKSKGEMTAEIREEIEKIERELEEGSVKSAKPKQDSKPLSVEQEIEKVYKEIEHL